MRTLVMCLVALAACGGADLPETADAAPVADAAFSAGWQLERPGDGRAIRDLTRAGEHLAAVGDDHLVLLRDDSGSWSEPGGLRELLVPGRGERPPGRRGGPG